MGKRSFELIETSIPKLFVLFQFVSLQRVLDSNNRLPKECLPERSKNSWCSTNLKLKRRWCVFATYITHFQTKLREYRQSSFPMRLPCTTLEEIRIIGLKSREKVIKFGQFRA